MTAEAGRVCQRSKRGPFALRDAAGPWFADGLVATKTGDREILALEQEHSSLDGRDEDILLHRTLDEYRREPTFARRREQFRRWAES